MEHNSGLTDRIVRVVVGLLILLVGLVYRSWWGLIGFIPLITGIIGYCPGYPLFGINTNKSEKPKSKVVVVKKPAKKKK